MSAAATRHARAGALGGEATTKAKRLASAQNGELGGRPMKFVERELGRCSHRAPKALRGRPCWIESVDEAARTYAVRLTDGRLPDRATLTAPQIDKTTANATIEEWITTMVGILREDRTLDQSSAALAPILVDLAKQPAAPEHIRALAASERDLAGLFTLLIDRWRESDPRP